MVGLEVGIEIGLWGGLRLGFGVILSGKNVNGDEFSVFVGCMGVMGVIGRGRNG